MNESRNIIHFFRRGGFTAVFTFAMALYFLNLSVDFIDSGNYGVKEDLSINQIETLTELVVEELIQVDDFFDEQQEAEREPITKAGTSLIYILSQPLRIPHKTYIYFFRPADHLITFYQGTILSKHTPPPKAV